ncbi:phytoene desaturase family protein [Candidatus Omnitrophota bacterium]
MKKYDAIIIGSGIGGLSCGCYLTKYGAKVLIVEQHSQAGGYCSSFSRAGYRFDVGVHYLGGLKRTFLKNIFDELELTGTIQFKQFDPTDKITLPDRSTYIRAKLSETKSEFKNSFPKEAANIERFFSFITRKDLFQIYKKIKRLNFQQILDEFFTDYKLKAALEIMLCNFGLAASQAAALTGVILYRDYILDGGYYPEGGMQGLSQAFVNRFKSHGGELVLNKKVERILVQNKKARGVMLNDGELLKADAVISNADATQTIKQLLADDDCKEAKIVDRLRVSPSLFVLYIGTDQDLGRFTNETCNIWSADTYRFGRFIAQLDKCLNRPSPPFLMISFPSAHRHGSNLKRKNTIQCFSIVPFKSSQFWNDYRAELTERLISRTAKLLPDLENHIKVKVTATPLTFHRYSLNREGAGFGWASTPEQVRSTLFPPKSSIARLFFTGHWCTIGSGQGGVPKAIFSGRKTARIVLSTLGQM